MYTSVKTMCNCTVRIKHLSNNRIKDAELCRAWQARILFYFFYFSKSVSHYLSVVHWV